MKKVLSVLVSCILMAIPYVSIGQWSITGNAGTTPGTNFLGTTDNQRLVIKTNALERFTILDDGKVGIGLSNPAATLHVHGTIQMTSPTLTGTLTIQHFANNTISFYNASIGEFLRAGSGNVVNFIGQQIWSTTRGAYLSNTLSGYALQTVSGNNALNTTAGNTLIGTTTDNGTKLQVAGDGSFRGAVDAGTLIKIGDATFNNILGFRAYGDGSGTNRYAAIGLNVAEPSVLYNSANREPVYTLMTAVLFYPYGLCINQGEQQVPLMPVA